MKKISYSILIFLVFFEIMSIFFTHLELFIFNEKPKYSFEKKFLSDWIINENHEIIWHIKNYKTRHESRCFDVEYKSNNIGARDNNDYFKNPDSNAIMLIGDSFAEGVGVEINNTFAKVVERRIDKKVFNFGVGGTNPRHQLNKYIATGKDLSFNELIYFFLPQNDYLKPLNDKNKINKTLNKERPLENKEKPLDLNLGAIKYQIVNILARYTYSYNFLRSAAYILNINFSYGYENLAYFFKDNESIDYTFDYVENIIQQKKVKSYILVIPTIYDINNFQKNKSNYKDFYWFKKLSQISKRNNTTLIDLMDYIDFKKKHLYFHSCDGHWSKYGNFFAAKIFLKHYYRN